MFKPHNHQANLPRHNHIITTEGSDEILTIHLTTLKSFFYSKATEQAFSQTFQGELTEQFERDLDHRTDQIIVSGRVTVSEFIKRDHEGNVFVCLDFPLINQQFVDVALDTIEQYNIQPGQCVPLSEPKTFTHSELTTLIRH